MKKPRSKKEKVFVALSGGVDSSVAAALLKKRGFDVTGVFIKAWYPEWQECNWREDRRDAMRVCAHLGIPFLTLDLEKEYKREVVDYMIAEYKTGRTPNPDVMCNKEIKFGYFLKFAKKNGSDFVATGHYAQRKLKGKSFQLEASTDEDKDQTYFLWTLTQKQLKQVLFPVGHLKKSRVRALARGFGLPTAAKKDSQGLCFIGKVDMKDFLSHYMKPKKGRVLDVAGKKIGTHQGALFLTVGQRHGFTLENKESKSKPKYIISKDARLNTITVSETNPTSKVARGATQLPVSNANWVSEKPSSRKKYWVQFRYRQSPSLCEVLRKRGGWIISLEKPFLGITAGQSAVIYEKENVLGGGIIE